MARMNQQTASTLPLTHTHVGFCSERGQMTFAPRLPSPPLDLSGSKSAIFHIFLLVYFYIVAGTLR